MNPYLLLDSIDPNETVDGEKPTKLLPGIYLFHRDPMDTEFIMLAPADTIQGRKIPGRTYLFEMFELREILKARFRMAELLVDRILDLTWNFMNTCWDSQTGRVWCPRTREVPELPL